MDNIDESVLSNLGSDNLVGLISQTPYQPASPEVLNPGVNLNFTGEPGQVAGAGQPGNVVQPGQVSGVPGVTPSPQPQVDPGEYERLRKIAFDASSARIEAEERAFEAQIQNLSQGEREMAILERQVEQTTKVNQWLNNRVQTQEMTQHQRNQEMAKRQRAILTAQQLGLPYDNEAVRATLLSARNPEEMLARGQGIANLIGQNQATQARQQLTGGVFAAGGASAGSSGPNLRNFERSGDLTGLIENRGYTTVNWG